MKSKSNSTNKISKSENSGVIQFHLLMRLSYKNLFFNKLRTTLTILAVIIGIGSIVFLFSFGFGLQDLVSRQVVGSSSIQTVDVTSPRSRVLKLDTEAFNRVKGMSNVDEIGRTFNVAGNVKYLSSRTETVVYGADAQYVNLSGLTFLSGSYNDASNKAIINNSLVSALGFSSAQDAVDKSVSISFEVLNDQGKNVAVTRDFTISGVFESESTAELFVPASYFDEVGATSASQFKVVIDDKDKIAEVRKAIESLGFSTASPQDTLEQIDQVFSLLRYVFVGFGGIGIIIAILGMFNTLTISLIERTREIALLISLGARKQDIRRLLTAEAVLLSFLGGVFGVMTAYLLSFIVNTILNAYAKSNGVEDHVSAFSFSFNLIATTIILSVIIGFIVVFLPARRATKIDPIAALQGAG